MLNNKAIWMLLKVTFLPLSTQLDRQFGYVKAIEAE